MQNFRRLIDFYIQSSLHVGLAVVSLVFVNVYEGNLSKHTLYPCSVFFGTILSYNFLKYYEIFRKGNFFSKKYYGILVVSILSGIGFLFCFFWLKKSFQIHILIAALFVLLYPFLRKFGWLKLFLVSFVVTYVTVYIPYQMIKWPPLDFYSNWAQRFLIVTGLLVPFEIMDSKTDAKSLNTLPQLFGIQITKIFGIVIVISFVGLEFLKQQVSYVGLLVGITTVLFINFTNLERSKYYTSFWVESIPVFWWVLLLILN